MKNCHFSCRVIGIKDWENHFRKPLNPLKNGKCLSGDAGKQTWDETFNIHDIMIVVGFKKDLNNGTLSWNLLIFNTHSFDSDNFQKAF